MSPDSFGKLKSSFSQAQFVPVICRFARTGDHGRVKRSMSEMALAEGKNIMFRRARGRTLILLTAVFSGCGGDPYQYASVRGKVMTCEEKPAVGGTVIFRPVDDPQATGRPSGNPGREARGTVGKDGTFTLTTVGSPTVEGALVGPHRVRFLMPPTQRPRVSGEERRLMTPDQVKAFEEEYAKFPVYDPVPCSPNIRPANVTVTPGENEFEFTLPPPE